METQILSSRDGVRIAYYDSGESDRSALILSNGLGGNIEAWKHLVEYFSSDYRIVSWDYRGLYGSGRPTDPGGYSIPRHVDDLEDLIDGLGLESPILVGWSMGVQVNYEFCRRRPDAARCLVAINGTSGRPFRTLLGRQKLDDALEIMTPHVLGVAQQHWEKVAFVGPMIAESHVAIRALRALGVIGSSVDLDVFQNLARGFVALDFGVYTKILEELGEHDASDVLPGLKVPTLIIAGEEDPMTPASVSREMAQEIEGAELCCVPGATHYCPIEFPELVNLRIEKFLRERITT